MFYFCTFWCSRYIISSTAVLQLWVFIMLSKQAFFIPDVHDPETARDSAFGAMIMFIVIFVLSFTYVTLVDRSSSSSNKESDADSTGSEGYLLSTDNTKYGTSRLT
jgi:hypothetical protein